MRTFKYLFLVLLLVAIPTHGLTVFKYKDVEFVGHGGFSRGYGSMIQMVPAWKFAVIVLTNKRCETLRKTLNRRRNWRSG